ncbi:MAG TPA: helix-turn-helix domain-containing protein [Pyrinomonadaceae bacterium]|nr:helix-turn-helix domain-containing protein [Pyrinomonadaceae bacterium]
MHLHLPPLRERREDVGPLAERFLQSCAHKHGRAIRRLGPEARAYLAEYDFPGNVRELAHAVERACIMAAGETLELGDLPENLRVAVEHGRRTRRRPTLAEVEAAYIRETLAATKGNKAQAARVLGISRKNLYEKLARFEKERWAEIKA